MGEEAGGGGGREHEWETGGLDREEGGPQRHRSTGWTGLQVLIISRGRPAPVPVRPHLSCFNVSLALANTRVPKAAAAIVKNTSGCVAHLSTTTGRPVRYRRGSPRWGSRWERSESCVVPVVPPEWATAAAAGVGGGIGCGG